MTMIKLNYIDIVNSSYSHIIVSRAVTSHIGTYDPKVDVLDVAVTQFVLLKKKLLSQPRCFYIYIAVTLLSRI